MQVRQIDSGITVEEMIAFENDVSVEEMIAMKNDITVEEVSTIEFTSTQSNPEGSILTDCMASRWLRSRIR